MKKSDQQSIQDALDGSMDPARFAAFQQRLRTEPELLQLYRDYAMLHHCLCEEFEGRAMIGKRMAVKKRSFSPWIPAIIAAAACAAIALLIINQQPEKETPIAVQATGRFSEDAQWTINGGLTPTSHEVPLQPGSHIELVHGSMQLQIGSAVQGVIEAPAEWHYHSGQSIELVSGRGRFRVDTPGKEFQVQTPTMSVVDLGTEFGVMSYPDRPAEVHVMEGKVRVTATKQTAARELLAGEALRANGTNWENIPASMPRVESSLPGLLTVWEDHFDKSEGPLDGRKPEIGTDAWRVTKGLAEMIHGHLEGSNFEAFAAFPHHDDHQSLPVMLVTIEVVKPKRGKFHTPGWAGLSFYRDGNELLFFGDGFGDHRSWALDIKQQLPLVLPAIPVTDGRTVTLRYDRSTGEASLHHGGLPLSVPFCRGKVPAGTAFDEIRLSASEGATLGVRSIRVQMGGTGNAR